MRGQDFQVQIRNQHGSFSKVRGFMHCFLCMSYQKGLLTVTSESKSRIQTFLFDHSLYTQQSQLIHFQTRHFMLSDEEYPSSLSLSLFRHLYYFSRWNQIHLLINLKKSHMEIFQTYPKSFVQFFKTILIICLIVF